jgi:hypothetical protein
VLTLPSRTETDIACRARIAYQIISGCMVDMHLHGPTRGHHKFTVASMVSRRAGRTFSDLTCGAGLIVVRMDSAYYVAKVIAAKHPLIHR